MKQLLTDDPAEAINKIIPQYMAFHHNTGQTDIEIARGYFLEHKTIIELAEEFRYHEGTIYQKIGEIKAFIQGYDDYNSIYVPENFTVHTSSSRTYILTFMTFAAYQNKNETEIRRIDIAARYPTLKNPCDMLREVDALRDIRASCSLEDMSTLDAFIFNDGCNTENFPVYDSIDYENGSLRYDFTDRMLWLLMMGKNIRNQEKGPGKPISQD